MACQLSSWAMCFELLLIFGFWKSTGNLIGCGDSQNGPVDWWTAIKMPSGSKFAYIDSHSTRDSNGGYQWTLGSDWAASQGSALANTLRQVYNESGSVGYVMWNDEFPGGSVHAGDAHSKGVLGMGPTQGFLLLHSVPKFPSSPCANCTDGGRGYIGILAGQQIYGQSFLCISLSAHELEKAVKSYHTEGIWIYDSELSERLSLIYPTTATLVKAGAYGRPSIISGAPSNVYGDSLTTLMGQKFAMFAKHKTRASDPNPLYEHLVEPFFGSGMLWDTWQNGGTSNNLPPMCGPPFSFTVSMLTVPGGGSWHVTMDHSKFGVTASNIPCNCSQAQAQANSSHNNSVCVGDMNRQASQSFRGGGAICFLRNDAIWKSFLNLISSVECPPSRPLEDHPGNLSHSQALATWPSSQPLRGLPLLSIL